MSERDERSHEQILERVRSMALIPPLNEKLGFEVVDFDPDFTGVTIKLPYRDDLVGNPETGVIHGGAITALMDASCGISVFLRKGNPRPIATLDLRIDYLRAADPGEDVIAHAECYKLARSVAFVRAVAHHV